MRSRFAWARLAVAVVPAVGVLASCGDKGTAPKPEQLAGTWSATRVEYVSRTTPSRLDLVTAGGGATLVLDANHTFVYVETASSGAPPDSTSGSWNASADVMTLVPAGATFSLQFDYSWAANSLVMTGGSALHDFGSGPEESTLNLAFTR